MRRAIAAGTILISGILLFARLGHYALWDDEAVTALAAEGVWRTGDTSVLLGHNIVAYRSGLLLKGTKERSTPPLGAYIAAPFLGIFGHSALVARLPFAFIGLASVGLMLWWLYTIDADWLTWLLLGMAIIGNVSFQLYSRQARYYAPAIFSSILIAYLYLNWNGSVWQLALMAAAGIMLLASNYLNYLALHICLLVDYLIIGRQRKWLKWTDWLIVLAPQVLIGGVIVLIWNTLGTGNVDYIKGNTLADRFKLIWMNLRDINYCEYGTGLVILAAVVLYFVTWNRWLLRLPLVLVGYVSIVSFLSPQVLQGASMGAVDADVRYLPPLIPLCIAIEVLVLLEAARVHKSLAIVLGVVIFGSNVLNGAWLLSEARPFPTPVRSTLISRLGELIDPPPEPYTPTIAWIRENVKSGESIWVVPDFATYPLMFHAPAPVYAWQFSDKLPAAFVGISPIHLQSSGAMPDYAIAFGPVAQEVMKYFNGRQANYQMIKHLDYFPRDLYRPELFWHSFAAQPSDWQRGTAIYIFKRVAPAGAGFDIRL